MRSKLLDARSDGLEVRSTVLAPHCTTRHDNKFSLYSSLKMQNSSQKLLTTKNFVVFCFTLVRT
ncbi:hypothetical protein RHMOL_Rhmol03G0297100 [Rhododendron molle]|nr:hypothetical protein RHMOL_Rhmol03G0297100 [Rhododendron molle]